jgi:four helix bundle protein
VIVIVVVVATVVVIATVVVAALVNGNDSVAVMDTVDEGATTGESGRLALEMLHFQKLDVYQRAIEFLVLTQRIRRRLPKGHADVADQLRRSAQSIPQNIAEGCGRTTRADKAKHYTIARGSAMESASHLDVIRVEELIEAEHYARGIELLQRIVAMLTKLIDP